MRKAELLARTGLAIALLMTMRLGFAGCPDTPEFKRWQEARYASDPNSALISALDPPPLSEGTALRGDCIIGLLKQSAAEIRPSLFAAIAESTLNVAEFVPIALEALHSSDEIFATQASIALARQGEAAVPALLAEFSKPLAYDGPKSVSYSKENTSCEARHLPWALASLALERIGPRAVPAIVSFIISTRQFPEDLLLHENVNCTESPHFCRTSLSYLLRLLGRLDGHAFEALYEARPDLMDGHDATEFLENLFEKNDIRPLLLRHPELLVPFLNTESAINEVVLRDLGDSYVPAMLSVRGYDDRTWLISLQALLNSAPGANAGLVGRALVAGLRQPADMNPLAETAGRTALLFLRHNIRPWQYDGMAADLRGILESAPAAIRVAAWKGLRDIEFAKQEELDGLLTSIVGDLEEPAPDHPLTFDIVAALAAAEPALLQMTQLAPVDREKLRLLLAVSQCTSPKILNLTQIINARLAGRGDGFTFALVNQRSRCESHSSGSSESFASVSGAEKERRIGSEFWRVVSWVATPAEYTNLVLQFVDHERPAIRADVYEWLKEEIISHEATPAFRVSNGVFSNSFYYDSRETIKEGVPRGVLARNEGFIEFLRGRLLSPPYLDSASEAAFLLKELGRLSSEDLPELVRRLRVRSPEIENIDSSLVALSVFGEDGIAAVEGLATAPNSGVRTAAIYRIAHWRTANAVSVLEDSTSSQDPETRSAAIVALMRLREASKVGVVLERYPQAVDTLFHDTLALSEERNPVFDNGPIIDLSDSLRAALASSPAATARVLRLTRNKMRDKDLEDSELALLFSLSVRSHGAGRRVLQEALRNSCFRIRSLALIALAKNAGNKTEAQYVVDLLKRDIPFKDTTGRFEDRCKDASDQYFGAKDFMFWWAQPPFLSVEDVARLADLAQFDGAELRVSMARRIILYDKRASAPELLEFLASAIAMSPGFVAGDERLTNEALRRILQSECEGCIQKIEGAVKHSDPAGKMRLAISVQRYIPEYLNEYLQSLSRWCLTQESGSSGYPSLKVPKPSDRTVLPDEITTTWHTLDHAAEGLIRALRATSFDRYGLYTSGDGFALVTGLERMNDDWSTRKATERWSFDENVEVRTVGGYLARLFVGESGNFRLLIFLVSSTLPDLSSAEGMTVVGARELYGQGKLGLPTGLGQEPMSGRHCYVLTYEYRRNSEGIKQLSGGERSSLYHLQVSGILSALH